MLVGNGGNVLTGGNGRRNILIAGSSKSTLIGGDDEDLLIAGTTAYDADIAQLAAIVAEWIRTDEQYGVRVNNLTNGAGLPWRCDHPVTGPVVMELSSFGRERPVPAGRSLFKRVPIVRSS